MDKVVEEYDFVDYLINIDFCNLDEGDIVDYLISIDFCNLDESDIVDNLINIDLCDVEEDDFFEGVFFDDQDWGWLVSLSNFMYECN